MIVHAMAVAAALGFVVPVVPVSLAPAPTVSDEETCFAGEGPDAIAACTRVLSEGRVRVRELADRYVDRGQVSYMKRDYDRAIADFNQSIKLDPAFALAFGNRANAWSMKKDFKRAIADYTRALSLDPDFPSAFTGRGLVYEEMGDFVRARRDYQAALSAPLKYQDGLWAQQVARERMAGFDKKPAKDLGPTADASYFSEQKQK